MILSTSAVAVCCSSASESSRVRACSYGGSLTEVYRLAGVLVGLDGRGAIVLRQKWSRGQVETRL
jgi:hypothetical protein